MKKIIIFIVIGSFLILAAPVVVGATSFNDLIPYQKQKYWAYIKECSPLLLNKEYSKYRTCALEALEKASQEKETSAWCSDSDGGKDFFAKGIVKTDIYPQGKEDYIQTFSSGATYLMEGFCSSKNQYAYAQKKCSDLGKKYYAKDEACVYVNAPPILADIGNKETNEGEQLTFAVSASDQDKDKLIFLVENLPAGATFENKLFSWAPNYTQVGQYNLKFIVSDGESEDSETIVITVKNVNQAPVLSPIGDKEINEGEKLSFNLSANDVDGDVLVFSAQNLPEGAILTGNTFSWTPNNEQAGTYEITFKVSDGEKEDSIMVKIIVANGCNGSLAKQFGIAGVVMPDTVQQTSDGGCVVAGYKGSIPGFDAEGWVLKLNSSGELEWSYTFAGVPCGDYLGGPSGWAKSVQQTDDGGYIITAGSLSCGPSGCYLGTWIFKLDKNGSLLWENNVECSYP